MDCRGSAFHSKPRLSCKVGLIFSTFNTKLTDTGCGMLRLCEVDSQKTCLYLPSQIRFPIGGKRVTCRGSKLTKVPRETTTWTLDSHVIRSCSLKPRRIYEPFGVKQTISSKVFSSFELGGRTNLFMTGKASNNGFCFLDLNVSLTSASGNIRDLTI